MVLVCDFAISPARKRHPHVPSSSVHTSSAPSSLCGSGQLREGRIVLPEASPTTTRPLPTYPPHLATSLHLDPLHPKQVIIPIPPVRGSFTQFIYFLRGLSTTVLMALSRSWLRACFGCILHMIRVATTGVSYRIICYKSSP